MTYFGYPPFHYQPHCPCQPYQPYISPPTPHSPSPQEEMDRLNQFMEQVAANRKHKTCAVRAKAMDDKIAELTQKIDSLAGGPTVAEMEGLELRIVSLEESLKDLASELGGFQQQINRLHAELAARPPKAE